MTLTIEQVRTKSAAKIAGLIPCVKAAAEALIDRSYAAGIPIIIVQGLRTIAEQDALYAQGRSKPGQIVTNAKGGYSNHNFGVAIDFALLTNDGRSVSWDTKLDGNRNGKADWNEVVAIAKALGFTWGGDWKTFVDLPHFEMTFGLSTANYRAGKRPTQAQTDAVIALIKAHASGPKKEANDVIVNKANVVIDGVKAKDGVLIDGAVYVPLREVSDKLGAAITWDNVSKTATITKEAK
ncbi:L-alanyl-D-glutamate peptidase [Paenibacillus sp. FSL R7-269]|uniref:M15 family metallopeptidase n=1 Tax=Paenibacillus sp. FSL R7-269 TaxID=1226755 RepID=UPI0003E22D4D|nr:M15 family metallopeptidase [Paenibacillus sp. FSL R7-269]ETT41444.1 L-alanyl-D-glutamate peptidase [Paenibacillus sp. FSL R7-269]